MITWPDSLTIRPLDRPGTTPEDARRVAAFRASLESTADTLALELEMIDARQPVLMLAVRERDLRADGQLRADARPDSPAVALAFESPHGALRYATDRFTDWQDNLRAIVLGLEALRRVQRYGIAQHGEQYRGYRAIANTAEDPREVLRRHAGANGDSLTPHVDLTDPAMLKALRVRALRRVHPDTEGGNAEAYRQVQDAWRSLEASGAV